MTNKIFGVERDVVLMSLYSYHTNLILSSKNDKPKIISPQNFSVPAQNLIFISKNFSFAFRRSVELAIMQ